MAWPAEKKLLYAQSLASRNRFEGAQQEAMRQASEPDIDSHADFDTEQFAADYGFVPGEDFQIPGHAFETPAGADYDDYDAQAAAEGATDHAEWTDREETPENWHGDKPEPPEREGPLEGKEADHLSKRDFHPDVARHSFMVKVNDSAESASGDSDGESE